MRKEAKRDKTNIGGGEFCDSEGRRDRVRISWREKSGNMRKELVGLYYLARINSVLVLSQFWYLVPVFCMVYRRWTPIEVSSENSIQVLNILFHFYVSPPSSWRLENGFDNIFRGSGVRYSTILEKQVLAFLTSWMRRVISYPSSTIRSCLWPLPLSSGHIKAFRIQSQ